MFLDYTVEEYELTREDGTIAVVDCDFQVELSVYGNKREYSYTTERASILGYYATDENGNEITLTESEKRSLLDATEDIPSEVVEKELF